MTTIRITDESVCNEIGLILKCLKAIKVGDTIHIPTNMIRPIILSALRGNSCKECHLDISYRISLYDYLKDKKDIDSYIELFLKECEEVFNCQL